MTEAPKRIWFTKVGKDIVPNSRRSTEDDVEYTRADLVPRWHRIDDENNPPPKDGTSILGFWQYVYPGYRSRTCGMRVIAWEDGMWIDDEGESHTSLFTHWMLLPDTPEDEG